MRYIILLITFCASVQAFGQLSITVTQIPTNTPANATIYVAGSFNNWEPGLPAYALTRQGNGTYTINLPSNERGAIEFKFTRGTWAQAESQSNGTATANRRFTIPTTGNASFSGTIVGWADLVGQTSTATASVSVISTSFAMPQLGRTRRIWLYLPPDYATSSKRYPVLYMHDGQNLFDTRTAFSGEWGVDESLDQLQAQGDYGCIVVGIDNGGGDRINEYTPYVNTQYGGGQGNAYVDFIVQTLKPHIDQTYRTKPDRLNTGIMGSSLGGLISLFGGLKYPEVFGRVGVFSPAFWINPKVYGYAKTRGPMRPNPRMTTVWGRRESTGLNREVVQMVDSLLVGGWSIRGEMDTLSKADGQHAEWFWRREFPAAYRRLFAQNATHITAPEVAPVLEIFPNPGLDSEGMVTVRYQDTKTRTLEIIDLQGKVVVKTKLKNGLALFDGRALPIGRYGVRLLLPKGAAYRGWVKE